MTVETEHMSSQRAARGTQFTTWAQASALLAGIGVLLTAVLWPQLGPWAIAFAVLGALAILVLAVRVPPAAMMRIYGARPYEAGDLARLDGITRELARRAGLPSPPRLYVVPSLGVSTFSFGSGQRFATALTEGLLRRLTMREVAAILAREVVHAKRGDLLVYGVADLVSRCAQILYYVGLAWAALGLLGAVSGGEPVPWLTIVLLLLAPTLMTFLQLSLPRDGEFDTDRAAALVTGDSLGIASAISRLDAFPGAPLDEIIPFVPARKIALPSMLRLPVEVERRIARLTAFEAPPAMPLDVAEGPRISLIGVGPIELRPRYRWPGVWF